MGVLFHFVLLTAQEITEEGRQAIESPTNLVIPDLGPEGYKLGTSILLYAMNLGSLLKSTFYHSMKHYLSSCRVGLTGGQKRFWSQLNN